MKRLRFFPFALPLFIAAAIFIFRAQEPDANAAIVPTCPGNVCSGSVTVGGQAVDYFWTQNHHGTSSSLKVRFVSGPYVNDGNLVKYKITVSKAFSGFSTLKNPSPSAVLPPSQTVNPANTSIERFAPAGLAGAVDFTQELLYASPAPGAIGVTVEIAQYGAAQTLPTFDVYLDAASPANTDEGESLAPLFGAGYKHCADGVDNDLDYRLDCADADCVGALIQDSPVAVCEQPEAACNDVLDNDGNGKTDCADPLCNGRPGNAAATKFCGPENAGASGANCADAFDNDGNGKTDCGDDAPGTGCWKSGLQDCAAAENTALLCSDNIDNDRDQNYAEAIDANASTGIDCRDYQCKELGNCPTNERLRFDPGSGTFVDDPSQCFNGLDDDLDAKIDCGDPDCLGAAGGPGQRCANYEAYLPPSPLGTGDPEPVFYFNYCGDGLDNDGDGQTDAQDADCKNRFGECGPSPATEDYAFLSCANTQDDDLNAATDCADAQCRAGGKLGRAGCADADCGAPAKFDTLETDAAVCSALENSDNVCGDGLDNDGDGPVDCADADCGGQRHGPTVLPGYACGAEAGASCHDGYDNDSNGDIDCFDAACQDGVECARRPPVGWTLAACQTVPFTVPLAPIVPGGGTQYAYTGRIHVSGSGEMFQIRFVGGGTYTSLTITVGDAVNIAQALPFPMSNCSLAGTGAGQMQYLVTDPKVGVIFEKAGETLNGFDVTLTCTPTSATPTAADDFAIGLVANRGGAAEFGENTGVLEIFENTASTLATPAVDVEGIVAGKVNVPMGGSLRFQALPANDPSGICRCNYNLNGTPVSSADGNCLVDSGAAGIFFTNDASAFSVSAAAIDGADNASASSTPQTVNVNVVPSVEENLILGRDANGAVVHTYRGGDDVNLTTKFRTDTLSTFPAPPDACRVFVYDAGWTGGQAVTAAMTPTAIGNTLGCQGTYTVPAALAAGRYWIFVEATDSSGDVVRSNAQAFLKCENSDVGSGACKDADFDHDGTPEGRYTPAGYLSPPTPTYPGAPDPPPGHACDNCLNFYNPNQRDANGNGVGDSCEAGVIGRCQYKRCSSSLAPCATDDDCGAPNRCIVVDAAMCAINCSADADCAPPGAPLSGVCNVDWGVCAGPGPDEGSCCFSNSDCTSGTCDALVQPFVETLSGQIYSAGEIRAGEAPPLFNATYCLQANGQITNFTSAAGCSLAGTETYELPKKEKNYLGTFGALDVSGILNGKYGPLTTPAAPPGQLDGKIYYFPSGLTINSDTVFANSSGIARAGGTIVVKGDLAINANLSYQDRNESELKHLASIGWIVLKNDAGGGGNVIIDGTVEKVVGAFFAEEGIDTGLSSSQLDATGIFVAKSFNFRRDYASRTGGAERVRFDARVVLNPPPGMADVGRSLPGFRSIPGQ